jgi:protein O-mannosyl-transferase
MLRFRAEVGISLLLAVAVLAGFGPSLDFGFLSLDDPLYVSDNSAVLNGLSGPGVAWAFTSLRASNWHPLTWVSLQADAFVSGGDPRAFHRTNVLLHAANAVLLYWALRLLTGAVWRSAFAAAFFAVHPLRVESVAWVAERKDVLCGLFWVLTLLAYGRYARRPGGLRYLAVAVTFAGALMSKPMAVTLPCVLLLLDYWPLCRLATGGGPSFAGLTPWWPLVREKLPLFAMTAAACMVTAYAQQRALASADDLPLGTRVANSLVAYVLYLVNTVWPVRLAALYPLPTGGFPAWQPAAAAVFLAAVTAAVVRARGRPYLAVGWLWYLGTLVPAIGLVQVGRQLLADRYTYLPSMGLALLAAWGVADLAASWRWQRAAAWSAAGLLLLALVVTWGQVYCWSDDVTLWQQTLEATGPDNGFAHTSLGLALWRRGEVAEATRHFREAQRINPADPEVYTTLGLLLLEDGRAEEAERYLAEAARLAPRDAVVLNNLGCAFDRLDKPQEAVRWHRQAATLGPRYAQAHYDLGMALLRQAGAGDEAVACLRQALRLDPGSAVYHCGLAFGLSRQGATEPAAAEYRAASQLNPGWVRAYDRAARAQATDPEPRRRNGPRAIELAEQVCDATGWREPAFLDTLAAAYAEQGRFGDAAATARKALSRARETRQIDLAHQVFQRLTLYESRRPFRERPGQ